MSKTFRMLALLVSGGVLLSFVVVVVNQTVQVVQLAGHVHPTLGSVTLWTLLAAYGGLLGVPVYLFIRLPSPLTPPSHEESPEFNEHLDKLRKRLAQSPHLAGHDLSGREGVEQALETLDERVNAIVKEAASSVFLATAISQSGRLDALLVVSAQSRMVWRIAHLYQQRPTLRDMVHLYANVAGTAFLAGQLEEIDLGDQVEPILTSALGALGASLPGLQVAGNILANCVLDGSANAFLTLRVGMIAKRNCNALVLQPKAQLRRAATAEAARYLGAIVSDGTAKVSKAIWKVSMAKVGTAVSGVSGFAKDAGKKLLAKVRVSGFREQPDLG